MKTFKKFILECELIEMSQREKLPLGKMLNQAARHKDPKRVARMGEVADKYDPSKSKRKEDDNRRTGGRKRDAGRPRSNELQDNW